MKKTRTLLLLSLVAMLFSSCQKDSVTFRLRFKGFNHDAKVFIDNNRFPQWIPEVDAINVNGVEYPVSNSSQGNTVTVATSANYLAVYPNSVYQSISGNEAALLIPEHQLYRTAQVDNETVQVVEAPMSAKVSSGNTLVFENAGALLAINVVNDYVQEPLMIDEITVSASHMALWGNASLDFSQSAPAYTISSQVDGHDAVTLGPINHVLQPDGNKVFYIYVPATPSGVSDINLYTISVSAHNTSGEGIFSRSQETQGSGNIARGNMAAVVFRLGTEVSAEWTPYTTPYGTVQGGFFSISSGTQVYFSAGNLQYYCSSASSQWRFAPTQTYICGADNNNPAADTDKWIDLFGWGASGGRGTNQPYETSTEPSDYGSPYSNLTSSLDDWGFVLGNSNSIVYKGFPIYQSETWKTMDVSQWEYLINPDGDFYHRLINGEGGLGHTFSIVSVNGTVGLLIYHDDFTQGGPTTLNPVPSVSLSDYPGCAFLPYTGYRNHAVSGSDGSLSNIYYPNESTAWYWTSNYATLSKAYAMQFNYEGTNTNGVSTIIKKQGQFRYIGLPVRLVCNVPPSSK